MPLAVGQKTLEDTLYSVWMEGVNYHTVPEFAKKKAQAIYDFVHTGVPMTIITTFPGPVIMALTGGPVAGTGLGGLDKPAPGMGLSSAKPTLKSDLVRIWTHNNAIKEVRTIAQEVSQALFDYFSQSIVQTLDISPGPLPAPPPVGPVTGPIFGKGGVFTSVYGTGYDSAKPILEAELIRIWLQIDWQSPHTIEQFAIEVSDAIHAFCIEGKVDTIGTFVAPAVVAPIPLPPNGAYFTGAGASISSTLL